MFRVEFGVAGEVASGWVAPAVPVTFIRQTFHCASKSDEHRTTAI